MIPESEHRSIKNWDADDRPREKFLERGANALTDAELIAILLGSGTQTLSAVDLGRVMLKEFGGLEQLAAATIKELTRIKGVGPAKALSIAAAFELARRKQFIQPQEVVFSSPESVANYLTPRLSHLQHETFMVLYLNGRNKLVHEQTVSNGGVKSVVVDAKLVYRPALAHLASAIIVAHNHPSGSTEPSRHDRDLTNRLAEAGRVIEVELLDHLIITARGHYSFRDEGLL
jgi:DNA repair protein RadC